MDLLRAEIIRRRIYHWLIPPVSLWVLILFGLAFSSASVARAENTDPRTALSLEGNRSGIRNSGPAERLRAQSASSTAFDENTQESTTIRELLIDGDPDLLARDLLPPPGDRSDPTTTAFPEQQMPDTDVLDAAFLIWHRTDASAGKGNSSAGFEDHYLSRDHARTPTGEMPRFKFVNRFAR